MKYLLLLLIPLFVFASSAYTYRVDTSGSNLAATFPSSAQLTGPQVAFDAIQVDNSTGSEIEVNCSEGSQPSSNSSDSFYVAGNTTWSTPPKSGLGKKCWMRSISGTISTGIIRLTGWGN